MVTFLGGSHEESFDASMVNGLQAVSSWLECMVVTSLMRRKSLTLTTDYDYPRSASLGLMVAMYSLGSVAAIPFVPFVVDKIGRRYPILLGGVISIVGAILQGSALNCK